MPTLQRATVAAAAPLTVLTQAAASAVPAVKLAGTTYTPTVGDAVAVLVFADNGQPLVLGKYT